MLCVYVGPNHGVCICRVSSLPINGSGREHVMVMDELEPYRCHRDDDILKSRDFP